MTDTAGLLADLTAEGADLDAIVSIIDERAWRTMTPADGWTVAHQIAHLTWTDHAAVLAATDVDAFSEVIRSAMAEGTALVEGAAATGAALPPDQLLADWRAGRQDIAAALKAVPGGRKLPWFGPPMSAASMATARLMETWAHGQDVADALGVHRTPTTRLRNVAHIGVRTVAFAFAVHGLTAPPAPFRVELTGPDGEVWTWGPDDAPDRVTAPALDFCLLVTQRRHRADLAVRATGEWATRWVPIAQAFAGPPGGGRQPGGA
ncbi:MAG TPA: TIGR03084 family metal-binding protein [Pseudonocardiaceae bacterium]